MMGRFIAAVLIAGGCWWLSFDLGLHLWWPIWVAPVPVLWLAPKLRAWGAFWLGTLAFFAGRLAWLGFLLKVLPPVPALLFTTIPALVVGVAVLIARVFFRRGQPVMGAFDFAVVWAAVEFLSFLLGRDGTYAGIAYTQADCLPVVQVAVLAGVVVLVIGFGVIRMRGGVYGAPVKVGIVTLEEGVYGGRVYERGVDKEMRLLGRYTGEIEKLAAAGAAVVLVPEKALPVTDTTIVLVHDSLARMASRLGIVIIDGETKVRRWKASGGVQGLGFCGRWLVAFAHRHCRGRGEWLFACAQCPGGSIDH